MCAIDAWRIEQGQIQSDEQSKRREITELFSMFFKFAVQILRQTKSRRRGENDRTHLSSVADAFGLS